MNAETGEAVALGGSRATDTPVGFVYTKAPFVGDSPRPRYLNYLFASNVRTFTRKQGFAASPPRCTGPAGHGAVAGHLVDRRSIRGFASRSVFGPQRLVAPHSRLPKTSQPIHPAFHTSSEKNCSIKEAVYEHRCEKYLLSQWFRFSYFIFSREQFLLSLEGLA